MSEIVITPFVNASHRAHVVALWKAVFDYYTAAHNQPEVSIDKKLAVNDCLFFVATDGGDVVGTIMAGYDGHRGWIYSLAVAPTHRRQGIGSRLVSHAEQALIGLGCVKINLQIMESNERRCSILRIAWFFGRETYKHGETDLGKCGSGMRE